MSHIIRWGVPVVGALDILPLESACYRAGEREMLDQAINDSSIGFKVLDANGDVLVTGAFYSTLKDREWDFPLQNARIYANGGPIEPVELVYDNGRRFIWKPEWRSVVEA